MEEGLSALRSAAHPERPLGSPSNEDQIAWQHVNAFSQAFVMEDRS